MVRFLAKWFPDRRDGRRIRHSQRRLARTLALLAGQGRRNHSDATELRDDSALRLATGDRAGTAPLGEGGRLPSQPTLSRRVAAWPAKVGVEVLREGLQRLAGWRLKPMGGWWRPKTLVIDIDSLPVEVHGEQPGSAWNGYYHRRVYHPIVAAARETGDILDRGCGKGRCGRRARVRPRGLGAGGTASARQRRRALRRGVSRRAADGGAGGAGHALCGPVRNNAVLKRLALPAMDAAVWDALNNGTPGGESTPARCRTDVGALTVNGPLAPLDGNTNDEEPDSLRALQRPHRGQPPLDPEALPPPLGDPAGSRSVDPEAQAPTTAPVPVHAGPVDRPHERGGERSRHPDS